MRKIGTISTALSLIFLGFWLMLGNISPEISSQVFKWWPAIIIFLGVEILVFLRNNTSNEKLRINSLFFVVVLIFLILSAAHGAKSMFQDIFHDTISITDGDFDIFNKNHKILHTVKTLPVNQKEIIILGNAGSFNIKNSSDNTVKIEADISVDRLSELNEWQINDLQDDNSIRLELDNKIINHVSADIYVPENCSIRFAAKNLNITTNEVKLDKLTIDCRSGKLRLANIKNLYAKLHNGIATVSGSSETVNLDMHNGKVDIDGNIQSLDVAMNDGKLDIAGSINTLKVIMQNGKIDINNKAIESKSDVSVHSGLVNYSSYCKDVSVGLKVANGIGELNGQKAINKELSKVFGTGTSQVNIIVRDGKISFSNQE